MSRDIRVNRSVVIPGDEIRVTFSTSSGPGGQHANKASTRVDLSWNVEESRALGPRQRARVLEALAHRIDSSGRIRLSSERYRSQMRNRLDAEERLARMIETALKPRRSRVATAPSGAARARRAAEKKRHSELKRSRAKPRSEDDG